MSNRNSNLRVFVLAAGVLLAAAGVLRAVEPKQVDSATAAHESSESLDLQLAKARLQLAKAELDRALAANQRMPIFAPVTVQLLQRNVDIAEARLEALKESPQIDLRTAHLRELESDLKVAEHRWRSAVRMRERSPDLIDDARLEVLRLRVEVRRLTLAHTRDSDMATTQVDRMRWELDRAREAILEIAVRVEELSKSP